ncbi:MAG: hypothetical protein ACREAE_06640 [Nitrosopumilaceae archaeon]
MIYLECDPDKALVQTLGLSAKEIKHVYSKGNVCNRLAKSSQSKGLVDEDPLSAQPSYIRKLRLQSHEHQIKILYDEKAHNRLIVLCPRLEEWVLRAAQDAGVNIQDYGLPNNANQLHHIINTRIESLKSLIKSIRDKSKMLKALEGFINSK